MLRSLIALAIYLGQVGYLGGLLCIIIESLGTGTKGVLLIEDIHRYKTKVLGVICCMGGLSKYAKIFLFKDPVAAGMMYATG
ncbi:hypothetical protein F5B18DRAFT_206127 [Nemania serpens]|nr:hypothetical protein F5B18DRAFT_206127 [Nemania serpens]